MTTYVSRRPAAARCLTALAFGLVALTACGGEGDGRAADAAPETSAAPSPSADAADQAEASDPADASASNEAAPWAGARQFVQIEDAWADGGTTYLSVRPAEKEAHVTDHSEAWVVVPSEGPFTEVPLAEDAQVLLAVPLGDESAASSYSQAEFVSRLAAQSPSVRPRFGYDLSFDGEGRVTRLESLYTS
ncbi:hypothetical protein [Streptomyces sp. PT12]|uniref:hypothetical protein n=1 Tax=Streptomyces sp. PT12 TaxID=1510197 RepID=UPI000DE29C3B|nr:hypothetical protein [Streptomyces sp. PT12]RBM23323.1 hypothetical protein DEH69_03145 [Streptomyces sp. PT12]